MAANETSLREGSVRGVDRATPMAGQQSSSVLRSKAAWTARPSAVEPIDFPSTSDDEWAMPPAYLVHAHTAWWGRLAPEAQRACARSQALRSVQVGQVFEAKLIGNLVAEACGAAAPLAQIYLQEAIEECSHSTWFVQLAQQMDDLHIRLSPLFERSTFLLPQRGMSTVAWGCTLFGELLIESLNAAVVASPSCTGAFSTLAAAHQADEALHVRTARLALSERHPTRAERAAIAAMCALQMREVLLPTVPRSVVDEYGLPERIPLAKATGCAGMIRSTSSSLARSLGDLAMGPRFVRMVGRLRLGGSATALC